MGTRTIFFRTFGGGTRDRTADLLHAMQALSQLSYTPLQTELLHSLSEVPVLAEWTGLEPATPGVTGRYSNQLNYHSIPAAKATGFALLHAAKTATLLESGVPTGIRTPVIAVKGRCPRPLDDGDLVLLHSCHTA